MTRTKPRTTSVTRRRAQKPDDMLAHAAEAASFLKAFANEQRLAILCTLLQGPQSVGQINQVVRLSQSALSQHLAVLREGELVEAEKQAQTVIYSVPKGRTRRMLDLLHDCFCAG